HDICSAVHPLGVSSPFFNTLPLADYGLEWVFPKAALAHPFDDGSATMLYPSLPATAATLGEDNANYLRLMAPLVESWNKISNNLLGPVTVPSAMGKAVKFGIQAVKSAEQLVKSFDGMKAKGFFAGLAAHSMLPLNKLMSASFG